MDTDKEEQSKLEVIKRFLALNKDIVTGNELEMLVDDYDGGYSVPTLAVRLIFQEPLMSYGRKTLLLVDEHGKLFENEPYIPKKFLSLAHLSSFAMWGESAKGSRVIFTGTAHAKYEMTVLEESYRKNYVVFVGPLSETVFLKLLNTYPRLSTLAIKEKVIEITNCVPRELIYLATFTKNLPDPISADDLQNWMKYRTKYYLSIAEIYYEGRSPFRKEKFYRALLHTFLGSTSVFRFRLGLHGSGSHLSEQGCC